METSILEYTFPQNICTLALHSGLKVIGGHFELEQAMVQNFNEKKKKSPHKRSQPEHLPQVGRSNKFMLTLQSVGHKYIPDLLIPSHSLD